MSTFRLVLVCFAILAVPACGGSKLVKNPQALPDRTTPLASGSSPQLVASLDHVIVRNGPGAWAKNADWDEYLVQVLNVSSMPVQVSSVEVMDSSGHASETMANRKQLVAASKKTAKRYRSSGIKVMAGRGGAGLVATGIGVGVVGYGAAVGSAAGSLMGGAAGAGGAGAAAAGGLILAAPVLVGVGIVRAVNNHKVGEGIESRATVFPVTIAAGSTTALDLFVPLAPSPRKVTIHYANANGGHILEIDTSQALDGLHLASPQAPTP